MRCFGEERARRNPDGRLTKLPSNIRELVADYLIKRFRSARPEATLRV